MGSCSSSHNISKLSGTLVRNRRRRLFSYPLELEACQTLPARSVTASSKRKLLVRLPCALECKNSGHYQCVFVTQDASFRCTCLPRVLVCVRVCVLKTCIIFRCRHVACGHPRSGLHVFFGKPTELMSGGAMT